MCIRDRNVTFPENYQGEEVAGKDAVFTVTVNSSSVETLPELTDEFVPVSYTHLDVYKRQHPDRVIMGTFAQDRLETTGRPERIGLRWV